jgi:hypothetical protein
MAERQQALDESRTLFARVQVLEMENQALRELSAESGGAAPTASSRTKKRKALRVTAAEARSSGGSSTSGGGAGGGGAPTSAAAAAAHVAVGAVDLGGILQAFFASQDAAAGK